MFQFDDDSEIVLLFSTEAERKVSRPVQSPIPIPIPIPIRLFSKKSSSRVERNKTLELSEYQVSAFSCAHEAFSIIMHRVGGFESMILMTPSHSLNYKYKS
jgi:hypothetical protein